VRISSILKSLWTANEVTEYANSCKKESYKIMTNDFFCLKIGKQAIAKTIEKPNWNSFILETRINHSLETKKPLLCNKWCAS
jgi:hypothetical protein